MPVEADIVTYLDGASALTAGTDLFEGPLPEAPDACVAVRHINSEPSDDYTMEPSLTAPGSELERFQVLTRAVTRAAAITQANAVHALLDNLQNATLSGGRIYFHVTSDGPPALQAQDGNHRWRYEATYLARKHRG